MSEKTSHTLGPWRFGVKDWTLDGGETIHEKPFDYTGEGYSDNPYIFGADGSEVVGCDEYLVFTSPENARLIAAAPELLDFALLVLRGIESGHIKAKPFLDMNAFVGDSIPMRTIGEAARDVITKATGA